MKKIIIAFILIVFTTPLHMYAKKLDLAPLGGISFKTSKVKTLSALKKKNIQVKEVSTDDGGTYYSYAAPDNMLGLLTLEIRAGFVKNKLYCFTVQYNKKRIDKLETELEKICNCSEYDADSNTTRYRFDNCSVSVSSDDDYMTIIDSIVKCSE